jgi:hypothetical protein
MAGWKLGQRLSGSLIEGNVAERAAYRTIPDQAASEKPDAGSALWPADWLVPLSPRASIGQFGEEARSDATDELQCQCWRDLGTGGCVFGAHRYAEATGVRDEAVADVFAEHTQGFSGGDTLCLEGRHR